MNFESLESISAKLEACDVRSLELTRTILELSAQKNPMIGAYSDLLVETALAEARASDARRQEGVTLGPLDGVPIAVKDLIDTTPACCKAGLKHLSAYRPDHDAPVVKALRDAGAVIIGVTETDPGAFSTDTPQTINPLAPDRSVGGSSGGSGAVVAAGLAFAALGTDTGGSVRIPAACCSVSGFKPTWGRVDATGVRPLAKSLDHVGPLARTIADLQVMQSVLDPASFGDVENDLNTSLTLGIPEAYFGDADDQTCRAMVEVLDLLKLNGIQTHAVCLPSPDEVMTFHMVNLPTEAAQYHTDAFPTDWTDYPPIAKETIELGDGFSPEDYQQADQQRCEARDAVDAALDHVDAILLPTMPIDAPRRAATVYRLGDKEVTKLAATIRYTSLFNQTGHPVVSMPAATLSDGRAFSIQLVGGHNCDRDLLTKARRLERVFSVQINYAERLHACAQDVETTRRRIAEEARDV